MHGSQDALIVGAGVAGIVCARHLKAAGLNPVILEARPRIGGKVLTTRNHGNYAIEQGALFLHDWNTHPLNVPLLTDSIKAVPVQYDSIIIYDTDGHRLTPSELEALSILAIDLADGVHSVAEDSPVDHSLQELTDRAIANEDNLLPIERRAIHWILSNREIEGGLRPSRLSYSSLSAPTLTMESDIPSDGRDVLLPEGLSEVIELLAGGLTIRTNEPVTKVHQTEHLVELTTAGGKVYQGQYAVITAPIGVVQAQQLLFHPPLPAEHLNALASLECGERLQVTLEFDEVFWPKTSHFFGLLSDDPLAFPQFVNHYALTGVPAITALCGDSLGRRLADSPSNEIGSLVLRCIRQMFGDRVTGTPVNTHVTRWLNTAWSYGATTGQLPGTPLQARHALSKAHGRVWIAGNATHPTLPNTLEGAAHAGRSAALSILSKRHPSLIQG